MKKLLPFALGAALLAAAGTALAQTPSAGDVPSTQDSASIHDRSERGGHGKVGHFRLFRNEELLSLLKTDAETLRQQLMSGKSLAEIAAEKGVSKQAVIDLLVKQKTQKIDEAVKAGKLTRQQAEQWKASLAERIKERIEQKSGFMAKPGRHGKFHRSRLDDAAAVLNMKAEEILAELKAGKSLAQIAEEKGVSRQKLINTLLEKEKERIAKWVDRSWKEKPSGTQQNTGNSGL